MALSYWLTHFIAHHNLSALVPLFPFSAFSHLASSQQGFACAAPLPWNAFSILSLLLLPVILQIQHYHSFLRKLTPDFCLIFFYMLILPIMCSTWTFIVIWVIFWLKICLFHLSMSYVRRETLLTMLDFAHHNYQPKWLACIGVHIFTSSLVVKLVAETEFFQKMTIIWMICSHFYLGLSAWFCENFWCHRFITLCYNYMFNYLYLLIDSLKAGLYLLFHNFILKV